MQLPLSISSRRDARPMSSVDDRREGGGGEEDGGRGHVLQMKYSAAR